MTSADPFNGLAGLRGLRSAPALQSDQLAQLRGELSPRLAACSWFTVGIMAPNPQAALVALRELEVGLAWPALQPADALEGEAEAAAGTPSGPVFLKGNQRNGLYRVRQEDGLGEGILITGHGAADPAAEDTWGPLPLDLFA